MLLGSRCVACDRAGPALCSGCRAGLRPAPYRPPPAGLDACASLLAYEGAGRELVVGLKYRNSRALVTVLGRALAQQVDREAPGRMGTVKVADAGEAPGPVTALVVSVVTWAPTSPARRRQRGYDQAELLARAVARSLGLPCRGLLVRGAGPAQTGRGRLERHRGPSFRARPVRAGVLLVDDVMTTGSTLAAAADALRHGGADAVVGAVLALTPRRDAPGTALRVPTLAGALPPTNK